MCHCTDDDGYFVTIRESEKGRRESGLGDGPRASYHIDEQGLFTVVTLVGKRYGAIGAAKRNPRDEFDAQTGVDIALARAYRDLADQMEAGAEKGHRR